MALFQVSVLKSHLTLLDDATVDKAYKKYQKYFWNTTIQENIKSAKEEQYQATFLNELFVNVLDYTLFPNPNSNLTTEFKNEKNARKADGAILNNGVAVGVIELKGTNTKDLESIRRQAFDYKANHKGCVYVITSNFEKLRFYINDATEFEEFDLFTLSQERFRLLYLCLHINSVLNNVPLKIKEASVRVEEEITKAFYKDYSIFKRELYRDLVKRNAKTVKTKLSEANLLENQDYIVRLEKNVKLTLFQKSQKLIDRFLFIFFAEDRMLLPYNSTLQILNKWKADCDFGDERPLYDLFKQYFHFLDSGRKGTESRAEIYAYNGGLFKPDAILDALEIDNDLLYKYTSKLSNYDFESQIDVNILGHIFENSLNEIESVNAEIEGGDFDKQASKRKKDGVFYTPKYITKYIVENTIGKLCEEKKIELDFHEEEYFKGRKNRNKTTVEKLVNILDEYSKWLLQLTICDPACGSGAFLNQALDFLIKEHGYINELKNKLLGGSLQIPEIENTILENNIYGVDLNEESVEIAKLSLWLRTAQPRRKLNDLSSNIKCGNSLIDDKKVAGDKAFKWEREFPKIFKKKDLKAYHLTTAVHDSRTSDRMVKYKVRERRDMGTNPYPNVVYFTDADDLIVSQTIAGIVKEDGLRLLAYNICADHIHLLLVCDIEDIPRIMQKIKAVTSKVLTREHAAYTNAREHAAYAREHAPLSNKEKKPLWQQKYSAPKEITSTEQLYNTINYIQNNRNKHQLPEHSEQLKLIIEAMTMPEDEAFKNDVTGGFDVVIGNPPYVRADAPGNAPKLRSFLVNNSKFKTLSGKWDLYIPFIELSHLITQSNGIVSLIIPDAYCHSEYAKSSLNTYTKNNSLFAIDYFPGINVFQNVGVHSVIVNFVKNRTSKKYNKHIHEFDSSVKSISYKGYPSSFRYDFKESIIKYMDLIDISNVFYISKGIVGNSDEKKYKGEFKVGELISETKDVLHSRLYYEGKNISKWVLDEERFIEFNSERSPKKWSRKGFPELFARRKIVTMRSPGQNPRSFIDDNQGFFNESAIGFVRWCDLKNVNNNSISQQYENDRDEKELISSKYSLEEILAYFNSKLFRYELNADRRSNIHIYPDDWRNLKIPKKNSIVLKDLAISQLNLSISVQKTVRTFLKYLISKYSLKKTTRSMENWQELSFGEFIKELNKAIKTTNKQRMAENLEPIKELTKKDEFEWMDLFEDNKKKAIDLQAQIAQTEKEIDLMVYELYGLTDDDIEIVENS